MGHVQRRTESLNSGAADNKFVMVEVSDANLGGGYHGAIEVYGAQCKFVACTPGLLFAISQIPTFITIEISTAESLVPGGRFWRTEYVHRMYRSGEWRARVGRRFQG